MNSLVNTPVILIDTSVWWQYTKNEKKNEVSNSVKRIIDDMKSLKLRIGINQTILYELHNNKYEAVKFIESFINMDGQVGICVDQENNFPLNESTQFCQKHSVKLAVADAQIVITAYKNSWGVLTTDEEMHTACKKLGIIYPNSHIDDVIIPRKSEKERKKRDA